MAFRFTFTLVLTVASLAAQSNDPAYKPLESAYQGLREKNYDQAIAGFQQAIALAPERASIRKDLAYTLLKIGENDAAGDQFGEAMRLDPTDQHAALEYAFLCFETKQQALARRIFDRIRKTGDAASRSRPFKISTSRSPRESHAGRRRSTWIPAISARIRSWLRWPSSATNSLSPPSTMK
jgi:Tfp pilus assembly protein PilF